MTDNTQHILRTSAMRPFQIIAVALCVLISMIDGFDVLAVAFTGPSISKEWALTPAQLGLVFSAGLAGMVIGSLLISPLADTLGRRFIVLVCLLILTVGMALTALSSSLNELLALRVFTGLGMGGILAGINTVVAEYASDKRRDLAISFMAIGYPIGAMLGGLCASAIIAQQGWHAVFWYGAAASALMLPLVWFYLPESLDFLLTRRPAGALQKFNRLRAHLQLSALAQLPPAPAQQAAPQHGRQRNRYAQVFSAEMAPSTVLICLSCFLLMTSFYAIANWTPKVLVSMGLSVEQGISGSVLISVGGIFGGLLLGFAAQRIGLLRLTAILLSLSFVAVASFGLSNTLPNLKVLAVLMGFFMNGAIIGLYALAPVIFPPSVRATGTGLALGIGRLGATAGPALTGLLIGAGWSRPAYFAALGVPLLLAAVSVWWMKAYAKPQPATRTGADTPTAAPTTAP